MRTSYARKLSMDKWAKWQGFHGISGVLRRAPLTEVGDVAVPCDAPRTHARAGANILPALLGAAVIGMTVLAGWGPVMSEAANTPGSEQEAAAEKHPPPHHTDSGYANPGYPSKPPSVGFGVGMSFLFRRVAVSLSRSVEGAPERVENDGAFLRENALGSVPTVTWIGHATLLVQMGHVSFLTDPTWSESASPLPIGPRRFVEPGLAMEDLPKIDFAVVSHNHYDHLDIDTLVALAEGGTRFFVPLGNAQFLEDAGIETVTELDWWQSVRVGAVEVHCVPARHWSRRSLFDHNRSLWSGWVVVAEDRRFYFSGDTGMFHGFEEIGRRLGPFELAAVPIGAYDPPEIMAVSHLNPEEAVEALDQVQAKRGLAMHYGTFDLSDEPIDEPPKRFMGASEAAGRGREQDWVVKVGETRHW